MLKVAEKKRKEVCWESVNKVLQKKKTQVIGRKGIMGRESYDGLGASAHSTKVQDILFTYSPCAPLLCLITYEKTLNIYYK